MVFFAWMRPDVYYRKAKGSMRGMNFRRDAERWRDCSNILSVTKGRHNAQN